VLRYRFGPEDLGRVRFAVSPLFELAASVDVLRNPEAHSLHASWARVAQRRVAGLELDLLDVVVPERGYHPDFVSPPPATPRPVLADELARVRATSHEQVRNEMAWAFPGGHLPPAARALVDDPATGLARLTGQMAAYWEGAIAPWWGRLLAALEADIAHHARGLAARGPLAAFGDLHARVSWRAGAVEVQHTYDAEVDLAGRGLLLVPTAFVWPELWALIDPPWQPAIVYAPRGLGTLWEPAQRARGGGLDVLLGRRRARILAELAVPVSTSELAQRLRASPAGVSEHLGVLRRAGLVSGCRDGRAVLYARTDAGETLLRAAGTLDAPPAPRPATDG
jgi:DNA-binding transcriptional ArsR family regulator